MLEGGAGSKQEIQPKQIWKTGCFIVKLVVQKLKVSRPQSNQQGVRDVMWSCSK